MYSMHRDVPDIKTYVEKKLCRRCFGESCPDQCADCGRGSCCSCSPNCITKAHSPEPVALVEGRKRK